MRTCAVLAFGLSLLTARGAAADPFTILPDGNLVFNAAIKATGEFRCSTLISCTGSGTDAITITNGESTATLTFSGVDTALQIGAHALTPVTLGTIEASASPDFTFPDLINPNIELFWLRLFVDQSSPVTDRGGVTWGFAPGGSSVIPLFRGESHFTLQTGPAPPGFNYNLFVYTFTGLPFRLPANGAVDITADAGAVPEPATLLLITTGLAGVGWARRRTRAASPCNPVN
jgi:hypothetical protein